MAVPQVALLGTLAGVLAVIGPLPSAPSSIASASAGRSSPVRWSRSSPSVACIIASTPAAGSWRLWLFAAAILVMSSGDLIWDLGPPDVPRRRGAGPSPSAGHDALRWHDARRSDRRTLAGRGRHRPLRRTRRVRRTSRGCLPQPRPRDALRDAPPGAGHRDEHFSASDDPARRAEADPAGRHCGPGPHRGTDEPRLAAATARSPLRLPRLADLAGVRRVVRSGARSRAAGGLADGPVRTGSRAGFPASR